MSVFGRIMSSIFGQSAGASPIQPASGSSPDTAASPPPQAEAAAGGAPMASVDVAAVLDGLARKTKEKLDWRHSIVDLMKLLEMDSSLSARKELAEELQYEGDMGDSAKMNMWLHKQVMKKLAENGGKVPAELKD